MLKTVYCNDPECPAYKKHVKYTFVLLHRSKVCPACGAQMVDGIRSNDDFKNGRKRAVGKVVKGKYQPTRFKGRKKSTASKRKAYKR